MYVLIERRICIEPKYLNKDIITHLTDKIVRTTKEECTKEHGYILAVNKITEITDNWISSANSEAVFQVKFEAITLKPISGEKLSGRVCMICKSGIFFDVQNKMKILVPITSLSGFTFVNGIFDNDQGKQIKKNDEMTIKVTGVQYSNKQFSSYGEIVLN